MRKEILDAVSKEICQKLGPLGCLFLEPEHIKDLGISELKTAADVCYWLIDRANTIVAYLDEPENQIQEIIQLGYAVAKGKKIWLFSDYASNFQGLQLLYPYCEINFSTDDFTILEAIDFCLSIRALQGMSPIEQIFYKKWLDLNYTKLEPQYEVFGGKYRLDFAHVPSKVAIELDGLEAHQTTEQIAHDRKRQREIEGDGWRFIRFGGKEIFHDVEACVEETLNFILKVFIQQENEASQLPRPALKELPAPLEPKVDLEWSKSLFAELGVPTNAERDS